MQMISGNTQTNADKVIDGALADVEDTTQAVLVRERLQSLYQHGIAPCDLEYCQLTTKTLSVDEFGELLNQLQRLPVKERFMYIVNKKWPLVRKRASSQCATNKKKKKNKKKIRVK